MADAKGIYILAELDEGLKPTSLTLELMGLGQRLASDLATDLNAVLLGSGAQAAAQELARYGTGEVLLLDEPALSGYHPEIYIEVLAGLLRSRPPLVLLAGHTSMGQDLLPRLAFALDCGLVSDCVGLRVEGEEVLFTRPVYGGNALATQRVETPTAMATVRARVGDAPSPAGTAAAVIPLEVSPPAQTRLEMKGKEVLSGRECPLEEAPVVVSGGRGMGGEEGFGQLREIAALMGGAVGASRPPVDSGWAASTCQVGITGKVVAPDIYIAVAISGSTQHLSGMSESGKIVAINKDPDAYIFKVSDYGVVGEWKQLLPSFTAALKELPKV
ncbi:MAG: electron transfer flavoprotein subunit alpha/FixB family protein [Actinomycetota bacterium]|nr:electron transfer flavoprotein subunit alpha/FixB family protein [Actinomycetota bacterium]MDD5668102.1 electron transfer flavoprotein subunit alpha/FixB family protein [Actinomycetota bacterium]